MHYSVKDLREKHISESKEEIIGWEQEAKYAENHEDKEYKKYCDFWISTWKNTLNNLLEEKYLQEDAFPI